MFRRFQNTLTDLRSFLILWSTQSFSALGSAMTSFALIIWSYQQQGSALSTALLAVCTYAPYVVLSIFAGALSDRWNKKITMLVSDTFAAMTTVAVLWLLGTNQLQIGHLYVINALNGLMNTVQQPASDVAVSLLTPKKHYQRVSGLRSFSNSLVTVLTPAAATALLAFAGLRAVLWFDLFTFGVAFVALLGFVPLPHSQATGEPKETVLQSARGGLRYLKRNPGILHLILFLAIINLTASIYNAALPAMLLSPRRGQRVRAWRSQHCHGHCDIAGQHPGYGIASAQKPCARHPQHTIVFHEHGKLSAGVRAQRAGVVRGRGHGLAIHPHDGCEHGCAVPQQNPRCNAGARIRRAQHVAVFHHSGGVSAGRRAGGSRV